MNIVLLSTIDVQEMQDEVKYATGPCRAFPHGISPGDEDEERRSHAQRLGAANTRLVCWWAQDPPIGGSPSPSYNRTAAQPPPRAPARRVPPPPSRRRLAGDRKLQNITTHPWKWDRPNDETEMVRVSILSARAVIVLSGMGSKVDCDQRVMRSVMALAGLQTSGQTLLQSKVKVLCEVQLQQSMSIMKRISGNDTVTPILGQWRRGCRRHGHGPARPSQCGGAAARRRGAFKSTRATPSKVERPFAAPLDLHCLSHQTVAAPPCVQAASSSST